MGSSSENGSSNRSAAERRLLQLLHDRSARSHLPQILAIALRNSLLSPTLLSHSISAASSLRRFTFALQLFFHLHSSSPSLPVFNAAIKASSLSPPFSHLAFSIFSDLRRLGLFPDRLTFAPLLKSASNLIRSSKQSNTVNAKQIGPCVHALTFLSGCDTHCTVATGIIEVYTELGWMIDAGKVFNEMSHRDTVVFNLMITGYFRNGDSESSHKLFGEMAERSVVTWNSMIAGLARNCRDFEALELFKQMWYNEIEPDDATLATILPVCARLQDWYAGKWIHGYADRKGLLRNATNVGNSLVDMYCKCGDLEAAWQVLNSMPKKNIVSWNAMINGLAFNGRGEAGVHLFQEMEKEGIKPNSGTFVGVLGCCRHAGMVERGRALFTLMTNVYGIEATFEHYGCMVDLLGRCGYVMEAYELIRSMSVKPNATVWGALLSACRNCGDLDIAEIAARELISLEPLNSGNYVMLSNLYAEAGRWDDVDNLRILMKETSVLKSQGQSALEATPT